MKKTPYPIRDGYRRVSGLFAFWSYDLFPYVLGGPVMAMNDKGHIQCESFGGCCFVPIKILPRRDGEKIHAQILAMRKEHRKAKEDFDDQWKAALGKLIPEAL